MFGHYFCALCPLQGKDFVSGGLDALENLGKKTMEVLTEGDPGELSQLTASPSEIEVLICRSEGEAFHDWWRKDANPL